MSDNGGGWDEPTRAMPNVGDQAAQQANQQQPGQQGQQPHQQPNQQPNQQGGQYGGQQYGGQQYGQSSQGGQQYGRQPHQPSHQQPNQQGGQYGQPQHQPYGGQQGQQGQYGQPGGQPYGQQPGNQGYGQGGQPQYGNQPGQYGQQPQQNQWNQPGYGQPAYAGANAGAATGAPASGLGKTLGWVLVALGVVLALVCFGTWANANVKISSGVYNLDMTMKIDGFGGTSYEGLPPGADQPDSNDSSSDGRDPFGLPILILGVGVAAMGVLRGMRKRWAGWIAAGLAAVATLLAILDFADVQDKVDELKNTSGLPAGSSASVSTGWGLWMALLLGIVTIAVGVVSSIKK
ncbi:DUF5336 domain-containing protein [Calidifontibacter indicus]|uniref:Uncharacterized protein n=1 Tax=Calidifontibacter indicus TaxID=419650 RepID=A0A3D9UUP7_9MICO|nr:DUF5336 domain-containing protein [Calidifontibacter indicus]REF29724.1 hypothetical protein DFJ65_0692 [Calidifontibacter indicus]